MGRLEEYSGGQRRRQRTCLGFAAADDASNDELRVVEGRTIGVRQAVAEVPTFVDGPGRLWCSMSKYPPAEPGALGIGPLEAAVRIANAILHCLAT